MLKDKIQFNSLSIFTAVFILAFCVGVLILFIIGPIFNLAGNFGGQGHDGYIELARNLVRGEGYVFEPGGAPSIHRPPAFPFILIPVALLPEFLQQIVVIILNSVFLSGTALLLYKYALRYFNNQVALISVTVLVLNPWILWVIKNPMTPIFQMFLVTSFTALILHNFSRPVEYVNKSPLGSGVALGVVGASLALTHGVMLPIVFAVLVCFFIAGCFKKQKRRFKMTSLALVVLLLTVSPWTYRNLLVTDRFVPVVASTGLAYYLGNAHWELGEPDPALNLPKDEYASFHVLKRALLFAGVDRPLSEVVQYYGIKDPDLEAQLTKNAVRHVLENPSRFVKKIFFNGIEFYFPVFYCLAVPDTDPTSKHSLATRLFSGCRKDKILESFYFLLLWVFAGIGVVNAFVEKNKKSYYLVLLGIILIICFPYFPFLTFIGHSLYTFSTLPFLSILTASGIFCAWNSIFGKNGYNQNPC